MTMLNWIRKTWLLLALTVGGLVLYGDFSAVRLTIYNLSTIAVVLLLVDLLMDRRQAWGIFPTLDIDETIKQGTGTPLSAALVWLGMVLLIIAIMVLAVPKLSVGATIPARSRPLLPVLSAAMDSQWPGAPLRNIPAGQVEQESAWKERATLKTSRELGRGLVQLTIAYRADGGERFNAYRDAVNAKALAAWDWRNDPYNVRYQLTYLVLTDRSNFATVRRYMADDRDAWCAALVCYNAGQGRWLSRRAQARAMGLPADRWTGGLEQAHSARENAILYGRPLWQAVNEYPRVIFSRADKYRGMV
jgi:hypothetical protein